MGLAFHEVMPIRCAAMFVIAWGASASSAQAKSDDWFTMGLGANLGMAQHRSQTGMMAPSFVGGAAFEVRLLRVLGMEVAYAPWDQVVQGNQTMLDSRFKLSLALH